MGKDVFIDAPPINLEIKALPPTVQNQIRIFRKDGAWVICDKDGKEYPYSEEKLWEILMGIKQ